MAVSRAIKIPVAAILIVLIVIALFAIAVQTGPFRNWLAGYLEGKINENMEATLDIGQIGGNLFTGVALQEVTIVRDDDTLFRTPLIYAEYRPLKLIGGTINIEKILIDSPFVYIKRDSSGWNMTSLWAEQPADTGEEPPEKEESGFGYRVLVESFLIRKGHLIVVADDPNIPEEVTSINLEADGEYAENRRRLNLDRLDFVMKNPDLQLKRLSFSVSQEEGEIALNGFVLKTAANEITAGGKYFVSDSGWLKIESAPLKTEELARFLPVPKLEIEPGLSSKIVYSGDSVITNLALTASGQKIVLTAGMNNVAALMSDETPVVPRYTLEINLDRIRAGDWLVDYHLPHILNGTFSIDGRGMEISEADLSFDLKLFESRIYNRPFGKFDLAGTYKGEKLNFNFDGQSDFGEITMLGEIEAIFERPEYEIELRTRGLNAGPLIGESNPKTDLNFRLQAAGTGFDPEKMRADLSLDIFDSRIESVGLDTVIMQIGIEEKVISIDSFYAASDMARITAGGRIGLDSSGEIAFDIEVNNLSPLRDLTGIDSLSLVGSIAGQIGGRPDSLSGEIDFNLGRIVYGDLVIDSVFGHAEGFMDDGGFEGAGDFRIQELEYDDWTLRGAEIDLEYGAGRIDAETRLDLNDTISFYMDAVYVMDTIPWVDLERVQLDVGGNEWIGGSDSTVIYLGPEWYRIENFILSSEDNTDSVQSLSVDGLYNFSGSEDLRVRLRSFSAGGLSKISSDLPALDGVVDLSAHLTGTAENPELELEIMIHDGVYEDIRLNVLRGRIDFRQDSLAVNLAWRPDGKDSFQVKGFIPLEMRLDEPMGAIIEDQEMELILSGEGLPLSVIGISNEYIRQADGEISLQVDVRGTFEDPAITGFLNLRKGAFRIPRFGGNFSDITLDLSLDDSGLTIDSFLVKSGGGALRAEGYVDPGENLIAGEIAAAGVELKADRFRLAGHRHYDLVVTGQTGLKGDSDSLEISGDITVNRSSWYLPALMGESDRTEENGVPMLVAATRELEAGNETPESGDQTGSTGVAEEDFQLPSNISGRIKVSIPRNSWLKSPDMMLEISGDLDIWLEQEIRLFGTIEVVRGHYDIYGKRFKINRGVVTFAEEAQINPRLDIEAVYTFRDLDQEKKRLLLEIAGTVNEPQIQFYLDDRALSEGDALSYIVFGRGMNQLSYSEQNAISQSGDKSGQGKRLARQVFTNLLTDKLTSALGDQFKLDVIEIKAEGDWTNASFVVGKYLTNDLFVRYQKEVGRAAEGDEAAEDIVTLEYQLTRFLFLQLKEGSQETSDFDIIFRFDFQDLGL